VYNSSYLIHANVNVDHIHMQRLIEFVELLPAELPAGHTAGPYS